MERKPEKPEKRDEFHTIGVKKWKPEKQVLDFLRRTGGLKKKSRDKEEEADISGIFEPNYVAREHKSPTESSKYERVHAIYSAQERSESAKTMYADTSHLRRKPPVAKNSEEKKTGGNALYAEVDKSKKKNAINTNTSQPEDSAEYAMVNPFTKKKKPNTANKPKPEEDSAEYAMVNPFTTKKKPNTANKPKPEEEEESVYEPTSVPRKHKSPTESSKVERVHAINSTQERSESVKTTKKKALAPPIGVKNISAGISNFFKSKSKSDLKSGNRKSLVAELDSEEKNKDTQADNNKSPLEGRKPPTRPRPKVKPEVPLPPQKEIGGEQPSAVTPPPARPSVGRAGTMKSTKAPERAWTEDEKKLLTEMSSLQVVFMGEQNAGKSSLAQSVLLNQPYLTKEEDQTIIADYFLWIPDQKKKMCISFVDIGGHSSYKISGHYFYSNATNNVSVLCHELTSTKYTNSFDWLKMTLQRSPKSSILFLLTKQDEAKDKETEQMKLSFIEEFIDLINQEIQSLRKSLILGKRKKDSKINILENQIERYLDLIRGLQNQDYVHITSCKVGYEHTVTVFKKKLVKAAADPKCKIPLPQSLQLLYAKIGKKGVQIFKQDGVQSRNNMKVFGLDPYVLKYLHIEDILPVYRDILLSLNLSTDDIEVNLKHGLTLLHQHGLLTYFETGPQLQNIVFHDMNSFVALLKVVFHHKTEKCLQSRVGNPLFSQLLLEHYDNNSNKFQNEVKQLYEQGLMTTNLLQFLLRMNDVSLDYKVVKDLLLILEEAALSFNDVDDPMLFIPFFIEQEKICNDIIEQTKKYDKDTLVVSCDIKGYNIPKTFWHYILVKVFKLLPTRFQTRMLCKNAIWANLGKNKGKILFQYGEDGIEFFIKGCIANLEGHGQLWHFVQEIMMETDHLLCHWWPGMIVNKQMKCTHCIITGNKTPAVYDIDEVILNNEEKLETFDCGEEYDIPIALITPLIKDTEKQAAQKLKAAREYLNCTLANHIQLLPSKPRRGGDTVENVEESVRTKSKELEAHNLQKQLDEMVQYRGTYVLRELLKKQVRDTWGHELELLLQDTSGGVVTKSGPSKSVINQFHKHIDKNKLLSLYDKEKEKLNDRNVNAFDITLIAKLLKVPKISGIEVSQNRWMDFQKGSLSDMLHPKKPGPPGMQEEDESIHVNIAGWVSVIIACRNEVHDKTDGVKRNNEELIVKCRQLKEAVVNVLHYLGITEAEMSQIGPKHTAIVYSEPFVEMGKNIADLTKSFQKMTGNSGLHSTEADHKLTREETHFVTENLSKSVCFIRYHGKTGTGFLLGGIDRYNVKHWYLLTCFHLQLHVAFANGKPCIAEFDGNAINILSPVLYCNENLDYAVVELSTDVRFDAHMRNSRPLGELTTHSEPTSNSALVIITNETQEQKIDFGARSVSLENAAFGILADINMIRNRTFHPQQVYPLNNNFTYYHCRCGLGTSGSPVLSAQNQLLYAMHCGSIYKSGSDLEYGVLLKHVFEDILQQIEQCQSTGAPSHLTETELQSLFQNLRPSMAIG